MEINNFSFIRGIRWGNGMWHGKLSIEGFEEKFCFIVRDGKIKFSSDHDKELVKLIRENSEIKKSFDYIILITQEMEQMRQWENKENLPLKLIDYKVNEIYEDFVFTFIGSEIEYVYHFEYEELVGTLAEKKERQNNKNFPIITQFYDLFSDEFNNRLAEQLRNEPKARIRKMFR